MTRTLNTELINNNQIEDLLNILADKNTSVENYQNSMYQLGNFFGEIISNKIPNKNSTISLACTVEDADFLAKGIMDKIAVEFTSVTFSCFWNQRFYPFDVKDITVAPILKKYQEPTNPKIDYLIIVKSIISGSCVVRTNLTNLIEKINPSSILVVAPVLYCDAQSSLNSSFPENISNKFEYLYFASDDVRTEEGVVIPGIGGSVYERLGFSGQDDKNRYIPQIVKDRRAILVGAV